MPFENVNAARADVEYVTNLGVFRAEQEQVAAIYSRTTGAMTDDALKLSLAQDKLNRAIAKSGPESAAAGRATLAYRSTVQELAASELAAAAAAEKASRSRIAAYERAAHSVGSNLTRYVTAPTALAALASVKLSVDFETSMSRIEGLVGASRQQVAEWSQEILDLAPRVAKSPRELAEALYFVTSSGIDSSKAMDVLTVSAKASAAGLGDTQTIANLLTSTMLAYKDSNLTAAQAADILVGATKAGKLEASDLAASLGNVLPLASRLGVGFDEVAAAVEAFSITGTDAETGVTNLSAFLSELIKVTPQAAKALDEVGLDAGQLRQELREKGLLAVLATLQERFHGNITELAHVFPNIRALRGELALTGPQAAKVAEVFAQTKDSSGSMGKAFQVAADQDGFKLRQALHGLESDATRLGDKLAPVVVDIAHGVKEIGDAFGHLPDFAKTDLEVVLGILAVGGPLLLGVAAGVRGVETLGRAWGYMSGSATAAVTQTSEELALLRAQAAETAAALEAAGAEGGAGLAAGIGAGVAKSEAELASLAAAEAAAGGGGLLGGRLGGLGRLSGLRAAGTYGLGGLLAGQVIESLVPGEVGHGLGNAAKFAGLGATIGSFVGPEGTAIGAGLGAIVGGLTAVIHEGPSFTQQMDAMGQSLDRFHEATAATASQITSLRQQIPNDRVARDQAQDELRSAQAEERATRGTRQHAAAVDRLRAAQVNLAAANRRIRTDTAALTNAEHAHQEAIRKTRQQEAALIDQVSASIVEQGRDRQERVIRLEGLSEEQRKTQGAAIAMEQYVGHLTDLANSEQSSNPKLASVARHLIRIAQAAGRIPSKKTIQIVVDEVFHPSPKTGLTFDDALQEKFRINEARRERHTGKPERTHHAAAFTTTIPIKLRINLQRAENAGDVAAQRKYLQEEKAFLEAQLRKRHTKQQELEALQALGVVDSQLHSLASSSTKSHKARTKSRHDAHLARVEAERRKLEINEQRAELAEQRAGQNKRLLERAYRAERRALQDEINYYRREAHDQQLSVRERQRYAKLAIAAEKAKLKIGKDTAHQAAVSKQELAQVAEQLQTILQNYAPNFFETPHKKPPVHVHVHNNYPAPPSDHHRQARHARMAMRAAFDG